MIVLIVLALVGLLVPGAGARAEDLSLGARVGFSNGAGLMWESDAELARDLDLMVASGARWVRLDFDWSGVEGTRGRYDWSNLDRVVTAVRSRGLEVLALPAYTPAWARPAGTTTHHPPTDPAWFAAFAGAAAARYAPAGVRVWEVWNEPNIVNFWQPKPDVAAYVQLLKATSAALRAAAPGVTVLTGGLSPASDTADGSYVDPRTFVKRMYELGAASSFDGLAVHPYSFPALPSDTSTASWNTFQKMSTMRQTMVAYGDEAKKVWLTETGAPTGGDSAVTEQRQAEIVTDTLQATAQLSWAGPVFFYAARDAGTDPNDREHNFGLVRRDFSPKPAWAALVARLGTAPVADATSSTTTTQTEPALVETAPAPAVTAEPAPAPTVTTEPAPAPTVTTAPAPTAAPAPVVPAAPTGLTAASARSSIGLRWTGSAGAGSYAVERSSTAPGTAGRSWARLGTTGALTTAYTDRAVTAGKTYYYRVRAVSAAGTSAPSAEARATAGKVVRSRLVLADGQARRSFGPRTVVLYR